MSLVQAILVRQALPGDAPCVGQLRLEALQAYPEAFASEVQVESARSPADWEQWVQRADGTTGILVVAYVDQSLAGTAASFRGHSPKTQHSATISGVYVRPAYRRQGTGTRLIQACINWARAHNVSILKLAVNNANVIAIQFYARHGFRVYGVEPKAIRVQGTDYDDLLMAIEL